MIILFNFCALEPAIIILSLVMQSSASSSSPSLRPHSCCVLSSIPSIIIRHNEREIFTVAFCCFFFHFHFPNRNCAHDEFLCRLLTLPADSGPTRYIICYFSWVVFLFFCCFSAPGSERLVGVLEQHRRTSKQRMFAEITLHLVKRQREVRAGRVRGWRRSDSEHCKSAHDAPHVRFPSVETL